MGQILAQVALAFRLLLMHDNFMEISVILPCFNEEENIERTIREVLTWFDSEIIDGEVVVANDGSSDGSAKIIESMQKEDSRVQVVTHEKNQGYGLAVRSGLDAATKAYISFVDSDGQFHISDLNCLIPHLKEHDFVPGRRRKRADPFVRNVFGKILGVLIFSVFGLWIRDVNCGMKIIKRDLWPTLRPLYGTEKFFNTELYLRAKKAGIEWNQIDVPHYPRVAGSPTGGSGRVIFGMIKEILDLRRKLK
ncbi:glycosyltransferase family 2 protein [Candidatus Peregrinibacteria bacterium]|jgi:glycosyltransferase involved in cell wall biosynthesis|nr:glycosyltransferase family 2 protein [Candidatus Peregrinibacteria bacterium]MBT5468259.1 glycosyltransferase family 2 protein [Candidatus Peregrinibacteria bacterium]